MINVAAIYMHHIPYPWNHEAIPMARQNAPIDAVNGQGLYSTR